MSHNFTPEEREARLQQIAPLWAAGFSLVDIGLEIGIAGKNVADTIKRARKRGDTRFPPRDKERPARRTARYPLTPDELAAEKVKATPMAVIARRLRVPPGRIKRMYYALRKAGDARFQAPWPVTLSPGRPRNPVAPVREPAPVVRDTSGPVTVTKCPPGYAEGIFFMGAPPGVKGAPHASEDGYDIITGRPQHLHRARSLGRKVGYNERVGSRSAEKRSVSPADAVLR